MSYDIRIGNAELVSEWPGDDGPVAEWVVGYVKRDDAPAFPYDFQPGANERSPSYTAWGEFCDAVGLRDLFYDREFAILHSHPGIVPLTSEMLAEVTAAVARWREAHPNTEPGFDFFSLDPNSTKGDDGVRGRDYTLARLLWLEWWMTWALANCERPAIYNR